MLLAKKEKMFLNLKNTFLFEMTEEELENFCDIPSADIEYALGYYLDNIKLRNRKSEFINYSLLRLYHEFKRIMSLVNNIYYKEEEQISKYKVKFIPWIILADHYRKEIDKELAKPFTSKHRINTLLSKLDSLYSLVQQASLTLDTTQDKASYIKLKNTEYKVDNNKYFDKKKKYVLKTN